MRQALERMKYHRHSAIPIINDDGKYVDTLTEDDLLWAKKNTPGLTSKNTEKIHLDEIKRHTQNRAVSVNAQMENLIVQGVERNFIPVVDDNGIFIGIVCRSELISYSADYMNPFRHFTTAKIKGNFSGNPLMRSLCFSNENTKRSSIVGKVNSANYFNTQFA